MAIALPSLRVRRQAASASLVVGSGAWTAATALSLVGLSPFFLPWALQNFAGAAVLAAAGIGILHRSVLAQVLARGTALWAILLAASEPINAQWFGARAFVATLAVAALWLAAPELHTREARAQFDPVAHRRVFLAGAAAAAGAATSLGLDVFWHAVSTLRHYAGPGEFLALVLGTVAFAGAAVGVCRMRAWGVLLGMLASVFAVAILPVRSPSDVWQHAFAALPGVLLAAPLIAAKLGIGRRARIQPEPLERHALAMQRRPVSIRVGDEEDAPEPLLASAFDPRTRRVGSPAEKS